MKTFIFMIFMLIAGAVPSTANYIGDRVEEAFHTEHAKLQQDAALSGFKIELVDYQRKLYDARATTRITIVNPNRNRSDTAADEFVIELKHSISHIPQPFKQVIATVDSQFEIKPEAAEILTPLFKDQVPFSSHTLLFFDGHQEGTIYSPAVSGPIVGVENISIEWQGLSGTAWQSAELDKAKLNINMPKLKVLSDEESQPNSISIMNMNYEADMVRGASTMWGGTSKVDIGLIAANIAEENGIKTTININTLNAHGKQSEDNGLAQGSAVIKSKSITFNEFSVTDVNYDVTVENIDIKAVMALQNAIHEATNGTTKPSDPLQTLLAHLPALYNAHPVIKINDLSVNSPMGKFQLKMDLKTTGEWRDEILKNPAMLATMIKTNIDAAVPRQAVEMVLRETMHKKVVGQALATKTELSNEELEQIVTDGVTQQIETLVAMGYIKVNQEQLESKLQYDAGQLMINGIDASPLAGMAMPQ
ncbi:MAG: YdgA family protein [Gammaproteobacteria bacterium]|nr:YdgA family protein [Gammaproteobacteria bacterium]